MYSIRDEFSIGHLCYSGVIYVMNYSQGSRVLAAPARLIPSHSGGHTLLLHGDTWHSSYS